MKRIVFVVLALFVALPASSEIRRSDMDKRIMVSEGQQLSTQVDIVSLYLSSEKVAYEPRITGGEKINVEVTVLSRRLMENRNAMRDLISRQTAIFGRELSRRLDSAAPAIAERFNPNQDIIFEINEGPQRNRVATMTGGNWIWDGGSAPPPAKVSENSSAASSEDSADYSTPKSTTQACNDCPALRKKK